MRGLIAAGVLFLSMIGVAHAQGTSMAAPPEMKAVEFLLGDFTGTANMTFMGQKSVSPCTAHAAKSLNDRFISSMISYQMGSPGAAMTMEGMHMLTYDPDAKQYVAWWFDGSASKAMHMVGNFEGDKLVLISDPIQSMTPGAPPVPTRSTWWKTSDGVGFSLEAKDGDKWAPLMDGTFKKS